jgi:hypothetical protein
VILIRSIKPPKDTKNQLKTINHNGHKELKWRETRKIKFLRPLLTLRLIDPKGTAMAVPQFVTFVLFVVKFPLSFGCGFAALGPSWSMTPPQQTRTR